MLLSWIDLVPVVLLVISGSVNTIILKLIDEEESVGIYGVEHTFFHPFIEAFLTFMGESFCIIYYGVIYLFCKARGTQDTHRLMRGNKHIHLNSLVLPNILDIIGTTCYLFGFTFTYTSSYQIFRGTVLVFVPILGRFLLSQKLNGYQIMSLCIMVTGLIFCGISDYITETGLSRKELSNKTVLLGDALIIIGQFFSSVQIVIDEKHLRHYNHPPLYFVGCQGIVGIVIMSVVLVPLQFIPNYWTKKPRPVFEDTEDAFLQLLNNYTLIGLLLCYMVSASIYYFAVLYSAKQVTSTTTVLFVASKALIVWFYGVAWAHEAFHSVQSLGFAMFVTGVLAYNNLVPVTELTS